MEASDFAVPAIGPEFLPTDPCQSWHKVEMLIAAEQRQGVLPRQGRNPKVITRDRAARLFQFVPNAGVMFGRSLVHNQHPAARDYFG